jgi:arylsulfatase A-like enzyme
MPLKQYLDRYDPRSIPVPRSFHDTFAGKPGLHRRESSIWGNVTEDDYRQSRACYYASTEQLDHQIGRILDALDQTGQSNNTIVVFTTDHGDMCGNHRMWIKGWIPYEETYRIPLIVRWPGRIRPASKTSSLVQTHDLAHTYVQAASAGPLPFRDGRALQPLFDDPAASSWPDQVMCAYYGGEFLYTQRIELRIDSSTCSTALISTNYMTSSAIRKRCTTRSRMRITRGTPTTCAPGCTR